jgi:hypothetical protein
MKKGSIILLSILLSCSGLFAGNNAFDGTTFTISSNVALPVHVRFGGKEIIISSYQYTTYTRIANATITDAHGNNCIYRHSYDSHSGTNGSYVHHYYSITGVYSSSSSSSNYSSSNSYSSSSSSSEMGRKLGNALATQMSYEGGPSGGLQLVAGFGKAWGEHLELRLKLGSSMFGWDLSGAVGKDWINKEDQILWNVATGMYVRDRLEDWYAWDVGFGVKIGRSACVRPAEMTLLFDLNTTHTFGNLQLIGITAGASIGAAGNKKLNAFAWDARVGIVLYFLQWNWF